LPGGNGRDVGIARLEIWGWDLSLGWEWDGNEVIGIGGNWYEKSVPAQL